jgi:DNA-binding transcriptional regulator LsrR (DeoR family)
MMGDWLRRLQAGGQAQCRHCVSDGCALHGTVKVYRLGPVDNVHVVQMIGGIGALNAQIDGAILARGLAAALGGRLHYLRAPFLVDGPAVREALLRELAIRPG